ncbi:MFS transporter [Paenibacillus agilis]|uniref:MFS transporter n=1 Tax=Paenibacillus agilis TaxID=3020863 RepID=A0A559J0W2_9BACL|nr:MFS transporter [Paenibacillus agilis]TVX93512.1 MFS transporter [Paenibacillus agilis]
MTSTSEAIKPSIFGAPYRALTIGIILAISTVAFEGLAITTVAPTIAQELEGLHLYGWIFSAFLLNQIIGTIVMGKRIDKHGVFKSMILSFVIFVIGILVAALSSHMFILIIGRALQGFGAGALITCVYYSAAVHYPDALRTKILASFSMAFVLPALIGPYIAGYVAAHVSWRFVFLMVLPIIVLALLLTLPTFRTLPSPRPSSSSKQNYKEVHAILLAIGTGALLTGLGWIPDWKGILLAMIGVLIMMKPLRKLLPEGTFSVAAGLPATIATRGMYVACYFATESFVVLALVEVKGLSEDLAGLIVAAGALSWSGAAWLLSVLDARDDGKGRKVRIHVGVSFIIAGVALVIAAIASTGGGIVIAVISQIIIGFGAGLANPTTAAIALQYTKAGEEGEVSAILQFIDSFSIGLSIGISGALVAISDTFDWGITTGIVMVLSLQLLFAVVSFITSFRITKKNGVAPTGIPHNMS